MERLARVRKRKRRIFLGEGERGGMCVVVGRLITIRCGEHPFFLHLLILLLHAERFKIASVFLPASLEN